MPPLNRIRLAVIASSALVIIVAGLAALGLGGFDGSGEATPTPRPLITATVKRETMVVAVTVDGEVSFGEAVPVLSAAAGTVTWLPAVGTTLSRGETLLRANEQPVALLYGPLPMFRPLTTGLRGTDVAQFEANLQALGYGGFPVDQSYTEATARAVKRWQKSLGLVETGVVDTGQVIYAPAAVRISEHRVRVGAPATGVVMTATGTTKVVTAKVAVAQAGWAKAGVKVTVLVPNGQHTEAVVSAVGTQATPSQQGGEPGTPDTGEPLVQIIITVTDQSAVAAFDTAPVKVTYVAQELPDILTVPVVALLALSEGGYGLEVVDGYTTRIVAVQVGAFAGGRVEVRGGDLAPGMKVVVPA